MSSLNKVMLIGNLGQAPEVKYLASGQAVCTMSIATNEKWKDKDGNAQERTEWHRIVVWGKMGEACGKYLDKGRPVFVEGRLQTRSWDDKDSGEKKYMTEIVANNVQFLGSKDGAGRRDTGPDDSYEPPPGRSSKSNGNSGGGGDGYGPPPGDDDIPF